MAAVELAVLLPFFSMLFVATVDYTRVLYALVTVSSCAQIGALYASDPGFATSTSYASYQQAALADATNLSPTPTASLSTGVDSGSNSYVAVTVTYTFHTMITYPGIPSSLTLSRTVTMTITPS